MNLTWNQEPTSNKLVAISNTNPLKSYWIQEGAWVYLTIVDVTEKGPVIRKPMPFLSLDDAKEWAEKNENKSENTIERCDACNGAGTNTDIDDQESACMNCCGRGILRY